MVGAKIMGARIACPLLILQFSLVEAHARIVIE